MDNIKEIIAKNLVELRRSRKLTQQELAQRLNYSDKAVSRWEHAETMPDIETLCKICDLYGVEFQYLLQKEQPKKNNPYVKRTDIPGKVITMFIAVCAVWIAALIAYTYVNIIFGRNEWTLFIWAIPLTGIICLEYNHFYFRSKVVNCVFASITMWTLLLAFYLQTLEYNIWMLFIMGVPIQAVIIMSTILKIKGTESHSREDKK